MLVQWYPGHMNKARKMMEKDVKLVDLVIEIVDARCPLASRNPDIDKLSKNKARLIILNKADLADKKISMEFKAYFEKKGMGVIFVNSKNKEGFKEILPKINLLLKDKKERDLKRGIKNQPVRALVCGIPNVGKSTFINAFVGKNIAKTGNKPGVTKSDQWIKINRELELLDTPGLLWPKFDDQLVGLKLAFIGSINDDILVSEELAGFLLNYLYDNYPELLKERFDIDKETFKRLNENKDKSSSESENGDLISEGDREDEPWELVTKESLMLEKIALKRGALKKGGEPDIHKASLLLIEDFRNSKIGRISLEKPL